MNAATRLLQWLLTMAFVMVGMHVQVAMALYSDPPHQKHVPSVLLGTQLPEKVLTPVDKPREDTLWCERHDKRMQERRNGGPAPGHHARNAWL
jgi:hypothetical protein